MSTANQRLETELREDEAFWVRDSVHWGRAVTFASLDLVGPIAPALGLVISVAWAQGALRDALHAYRDHGERADRLSFVRPFLAEKLARDPDWVALSIWVDEVFSVHDHDQPEWCAWQEAFVAWSRRRDGQALAFQPSRVERIRSCYLESMDLEAMRNQLATARRAKRTDWDVECFARMGWFPGDTYDDPFDLVMRTATTQRFRQFSEWLVEGVVSSSDEHELRASAVELLNERGHDLAEPDLPTLTELLRSDPIP
ncbi:MAG: hypothetical protein KC731_05615 [Myxococcales bacterium]|nr:hypothetical protein [Myxococcales bacterium]